MNFLYFDNFLEHISVSQPRVAWPTQLPLSVKIVARSYLPVLSFIFFGANSLASRPFATSLFAPTARGFLSRLLRCRSHCSTSGYILLARDCMETIWLDAHASCVYVTSCRALIGRLFDSTLTRLACTSGAVLKNRSAAIPVGRRLHSQESLALRENSIGNL